MKKYKVYNGVCTKIIELDSNFYKVIYLYGRKAKVYGFKTKYGPLPKETIDFLLNEWDAFFLKQFRGDIDKKEIEEFCKETFHAHVEEYIESYILLPTRKELNVLKNSKSPIPKYYQDEKGEGSGSITLMPCPKTMHVILPLFGKPEAELMVEQIDTQIEVIYKEERALIRNVKFNNEKENEKKAV